MKRLIIYISISIILIFAVLIAVYPLLEEKLYLGDVPHHADTIIVLSGDAEPYFLRTKKAITLYKEGYAPYIIFSGYGYGGDSAQFLAKIAMRFSIPTKAIIIEPNARTTYENFLFSKPIVLKHAFRSIIIVTSPYHQLRAYLVAKKIFNGTGVKIYNCASHKPCDNGCSIQYRIREARFTMMEYFKLLGYYLLGRI
ncbi:MAG: YdcF family protein [bacterium]